MANKNLETFLGDWEMVHVVTAVLVMSSSSSLSFKSSPSFSFVYDGPGETLIS